jgi:Beta-galactosidase
VNIMNLKTTQADFYYRRHRQYVCLLFSIFLGFACSSSSSSAHPVERASRPTNQIDSRPGINQPNWALRSEREHREMYTNVQDAGFGWIRLYLPWNEIEVTQGVYNWGPYGAAVELAHDMGLSVLAVLSAPIPCWAAQPNCSGCRENPGGVAYECLPKDNKVFRSFASAAVRQLAGARNVSMILRQRVSEFYVASAVAWSGRDMVA